MMKTRLLSMALLAGTLGFTPLTSAESDDGSSAMENVRTETRELIDALKNYGVEQREQAAERAERGLTALDQRMDSLESNIDENWDRMDEAAREKARATMRTLRRQRTELAEWYGGFKNASADAWAQMRKGFTDAYRTLSESWQEAGSEYGAEGE